MNKRLVFGLLAAIVTQILFGYIFSLLPISNVLQMACVSFLGAVIGSYVANRNFLVPATIVWFLSWLFMLYILFRISNGQASAYTLLEFNKVALAVSLLAAILGCVMVNIRNHKNQVATI